MEEGVRRVIHAVEALLRGLSPEAQAAVVGGIAGGVVGGVFTLLGTVLGLFGERWVRRIGWVRCALDWTVMHTDPERPEERRVLVRTLDVRFLNRKDVDVNVLEMGVKFYRGRNTPLVGPEAPRVWISKELALREGRLHLPSRKPVSVVIRVDADTPAQRAALEEVRRAFFVAKIDGAFDKRKPLRPPWKFS